MALTNPLMEDDAFTLIEERGQPTLYKDYADHLSAKTADHDVQIQDWLRSNHRGLNLTAIPAGNAPLLAFANAGNAKATLDTTTEPVVRWRGYTAPARRGGKGGLGDSTFFAKYHYVWASEDFIIYNIGNGYQNILYILKEPNTSQGEDTLSHCSIVDKLILTAVEWAQGDQTKFIYVYDGYWSASRELWDQIQKAEWKDVILDPAQKKALTSVSNTFFDSEEVYRRYGVPWKRGLIFYGPPGNGKTVSIKALMHELYRREKPIPTLYVKSAPRTYDIRQIFMFARRFKPCLLVMEDIETIVTNSSRSYFFNEVDGLENNDGILMVASTNYLDRLDPGLSQRPSRFDRKYLFPLPNFEERTLYAAYWRTKLSKSAPTIEFPETLCGAIAKITKDFSFAFLQEAFVAALLDLARNGAELARAAMEKELYADQGGVSFAEEDSELAGKSMKAAKHKHDELDKYPLWTALKASIKTLRGDLGKGESTEARKTVARSKSSNSSTVTDLPDSTLSRLSGLSFAVTGDLPSVGDRAQVYDLIRRHGGAIDLKPDARTSYLVVRTDAGAKKVDNAEKNYVKTTDGQGLLDLIASGQEATAVTKDNVASAHDDRAPQPSSGFEQNAGDAEADEETKQTNDDVPDEDEVGEENQKLLKEDDSDTLTGLSFAVTGYFPGLDRALIYKLITGYGGEVMTQPEVRTSYVLVGGEPGPKKMSFIEKHDLKTINDIDLFDLIANGPQVELHEEEEEGDADEIGDIEDLENEGAVEEEADAEEEEGASAVVEKEADDGAQERQRDTERHRSGSLAGLSFAFTTRGHMLTRSQARYIVEKHDGNFANTATAKTDYVVFSLRLSSEYPICIEGHKVKTINEGGLFDLIAFGQTPPPEHFGQHQLGNKNDPMIMTMMQKIEDKETAQLFLDHRRLGDSHAHLYMAYHRRAHPYGPCNKLLQSKLLQHYVDRVAVQSTFEGRPTLQSTDLTCDDQEDLDQGEEDSARPEELSNDTLKRESYKGKTAMTPTRAYDYEKMFQHYRLDSKWPENKQKPGAVLTREYRQWAYDAHGIDLSHDLPPSHPDFHSLKTNYDNLFDHEDALRGQQHFDSLYLEELDVTPKSPRLRPVDVPRLRPDGSRVSRGVLRPPHEGEAEEVTGEQLYSVGVGKGNYLTASAFEQTKLQWD